MSSSVRNAKVDLSNDQESAPSSEKELPSNEEHMESANHADPDSPESDDGNYEEIPVVGKKRRFFFSGP